MNDMDTADGLGTLPSDPRERQRGEDLTEYDERRANERESDSLQLDLLAATLNEYEDVGAEWDHAEICNALVRALRATGRTVHIADD
jgi:hypothetical protein